MWNYTNLQSLDLNRNCVLESPLETESLKETCVHKKCVKKAPDPQTGLHRNLNHNDNEKVHVAIWLFFLLELQGPWCENFDLYLRYRLKV